LWRLIGGTALLKYAGIISGQNWTTQPLFDNSKAFATTEFVQRAQGNFSGQTNIATLPAALTPAMAGRRIVVTAPGPGTLTLPPLAASSVGSKFYILNSGPSDITVIRQGADNIVALAKSLTSITIQSASNAVLACGDVNYVVEEGVSSLKYSNEFSALLSPNGYQKLPSGLIIQWMTALFSKAALNTPFNLPTAFPNANFGCVVSQTDSTIYGTGGSPFVAGMANGLGQVVLQSNYTASQSAVRVLAFGM